jgi:hypothetical protein
MKRIVAMYVFLILATASFAQDAEKEKLRQLE